MKETKLGTYSLVTTNSRAIENIIEYYKNTMKGMKSLEYRIWSRSYFKYKGDFESLTKIRHQMRDIRSKRYTLTHMKINKMKE